MRWDRTADCGWWIKTVKLRRVGRVSSTDVLVVLHAVVPVPLGPLQLLHRIKTAPIAALSICRISVRLNMRLILIMIVVSLGLLWMLI